MKIIRYAIVVICLLSLTGLVAVERTSASFSDTEQSSGNVFQVAMPESEPEPPVGGGGMGDRTPPEISNISVSNISKTTADIYWETDEKSTSQVEYWSSPGTLTPLDKTYAKGHLVHLTGLTSGITYYYKTISKDRSGNKEISNEQTFATLEEVVIVPEPTLPEPVEPVIVVEEPKPEPEPIIVSTPELPVATEPIPEEPFSWLPIGIGVAVIILIVAGGVYWLRRKGH